MTTDNKDTSLDYIASAMGTAPESLHAFTTFNHRHLFHALVAASETGAAINGIKKALVYGRELPDDSPLRDSPPIAQSEFGEVPEAILHGIVGIISEAGELADFLLAVIYGRDELDIPNLREEMGDLQWYQARIADYLGEGFGAWQKGNIAKLDVRHRQHTGGFNPAAATEDGRDRAAEQAAADAAFVE